MRSTSFPSRLILAILSCLIFTGGAQLPARAGLRPEKIYVADQKKTKNYIQDGLIIGGNRSTQEFIIQDIRHATNPEFERVVIDLESSEEKSGATENTRAPYYQVAVTPDENRLILSLYGKPKLSFNLKKVTQAFQRSLAIQKLNLLPHLDDQSWTFAFNLKPGHPVEVFELSHPLRIILDIRHPSSRPHDLPNSN